MHVLMLFLCRWFPARFSPCTVALGLNRALLLFNARNFSRGHTRADVPPVVTVALAKLLSVQMTKNKTMTSSVPASPMLSVMVHINHSKVPCTQSSLFFVPLPPTCPLQTSSANRALLLADGFLMTKLWHFADGSLHLLQPPMQVMAALMTKAVGGLQHRKSVVCVENLWEYETQDPNV